MKFFTLSLIVAGTIALTGCSTLVSLNPFVTDEQAVLDSGLPGVWVSQDGKETYMIRQEGTGYNIRFLSDSSESYQFKAKLLVAGDVKLLDLVSANDDAFQLTVHTPVRVWVDSNTLRMSLLQSDWLKEQAGSQLPTVPTGGRTVITAPGEVVRAFLVKAGANLKASDEPDLLRRVQ